MLHAPTITYDAIADAVAVRFAHAPQGAQPITRVLDPAHPQIRGDFLGSQLLGLEILGASALLSREALAGLAHAGTWLTLEEAARQAKRQPRTLRAAIAAGKMPRAEKRGRDWLVPEAELWSYLEALGPAGRPPKSRNAPRRKRVAAR